MVNRLLSWLALVTLVTPTGSEAQPLSWPEVRTKIARILPAHLLPYRKALVTVMELSPEYLETNPEHIRTFLSQSEGSEVKLDSFQGSTVHSRIFEWPSGHTIFTSVDRSETKLKFSYYMGGQPVLLSGCAFDLAFDLSAMGGACDHYEPGGKRDRSIYYDDQLNRKKIDYYRDPPIRSLIDIYGKGFVEPTLEIKVAVIDTGVDYNHPALARNIPRTRADDGSLKILGWDFDDHDDRAFDLAQDSLASHGTGVAEMVVRVYPQVEIVPIRIPASGQLFESVAYAHSQGARIVNLSIGIPEEVDDPSRKDLEQELARAIREMTDVIFVISAGNEGLDITESKRIPQTLNLDNMIVVGSINRDRSWTMHEDWGSNYSQRLVHTAAIGYEIRIAIPGGTFEISGGTSFAAPQVAGLLATLKVKNPEADPRALTDLLKRDLIALESLKDRTIFGGVPSSLLSAP